MHSGHRAFSAYYRCLIFLLFLGMPIAHASSFAEATADNSARLRDEGPQRSRSGVGTLAPQASDSPTIRVGYGGSEWKDAVCEKGNRNSEGLSLFSG